MDKINLLTKISQTKAILEIKEKDLTQTYVYAEKLRREIYNIKDDICSQLSDLYKEYIGKKVEIMFEFEDCWQGRKEVVNKKIVGFLKEFDHKKNFGSGIKPVIMKVKKDGSGSMVPYNTYECGTYQQIKEIKIVE